MKLKAPTTGLISQRLRVLKRTHAGIGASLSAFLIVCILASIFFWIRASAASAILFKQDFSSSTVVTDYVSATPNNGQFNAIGTSGAGVTVSITSGALQYTRAVTNTGSFSRTTDFSATPASLLYQVDLSVSGNTSATTSAGVIQVGSNFGTANAAEAVADTYARFAINFTATDGTFQIRDITNVTNSANFSGTQTITWALNNSGSTLTYVAPDGTQESVANDTADLWIGTTKAFNDVAIQTTTQTMTDLKFAFAAGTGTIKIDNIQIDPLSSLVYRSAQSGNWNSASTWETSTDGGSTFYAALNPPTSAADSITIRSPHNVTVTANVNADQLTVDSGGTLTVNNGVNFTLDDGAGTDLTDNGMVATAGTITNNGQAVINGTAQVNTGGFVSGSPTYGGSSLLKYNTGGTYGRNGEWLPGATSGAGYPANVQISGNTTLDLPNSSTSPFQLGGSLTIDLGSALTLSNTGGADLTIGGSFTNSGTYNHNGRTTIFNGTGAQTITTGGSGVGKTFAGFTINKSSGAATLAGNLSATGLSITAGTLDQGATFDITTGSVTVGAGGIWTNTGTGDLTLSGGVSNTGAITFNANGLACNGNDDILIRSTGGQQAWTGSGTFSMTDVDVQDQAGAALITVHNGTNSTGNGANWIFVASCTANTYTWANTLSGDWTVAANWSPARLLPDPGDVLFFNSSTPSPTVTNVANVVGNNETIAELHIANGVTPTFSTGAANTLTINAGATTGFDVYALAITGSNALTIKLASGTLGTVANAMSFAGGGHRLIGQAASAILFQNGSTFSTQSGFTGNAFGDGSSATNGAAGSIVFVSGAFYQHSAGSSPFGASGNASVVTFQTGSTAQYFTGTGFDGSNRTYANLIIGDSGGAVTASASGSGNFQFDNLTINSTGTTNSQLTFNGSGSSTVTIRGNIQSTGTGAGSFPDVLLTAGSGGIQINKPGGGTLNFSNTGNTRSIDFESDATVDSATSVNLGRIVQMGISPTHLLTVNGTISPNQGAPGYVIGNLKKTFASAVSKTFEVGTINGYSPVSANVTTGTLPADFTAKANQGKLPSISGTNALQRYWTLTASGITADLTFNYLAGDVIGTETSYKFFRYDGGFTQFNPSSLDNTNHIATLNGVSQFSDWTLAEPSAVPPTAANGNVSGQIVDSNGNPVEGVGVRMTGTQNRLTVTDAQGVYRFDNVETNGFYTLMASRANFTFNPSQRAFSQLGQHTDAAFNALPTGVALNPLDTTEYFVRQQYVDFLNREPDESGFNFWVNNIESCGTDANCRAVKRIDTSAAFFVSIEFQQTGYLVYRTYQAAYGDLPNAPVPIRLNEFKPDTQRVGNGVVVLKSGWEQELENNKQVYMAEFVQRARFTAAYPQLMTPVEFVDKLFTNAGVTPVDSERTAAINEFGSAATSADVAARGLVLRRVAENSVPQQEFNRAFVLMQYFGYLRRDADSGPDTDFSGYNFWLEKLDDFGGNFRGAEMVKAFLVSGEYRGRFPR